MKPLRTITAALAFGFSAGCALAAPALKADIVVTASVVTVGDMFEDAGALAETPLFRAPRPGTTGNVDLTALKSATARIGLVEFETKGLTAVRVSRAAALVDETLLSGLIAADLRARGILTEGMHAQTRFSASIGTLEAAATDHPAHLDNLRYLPGNGTFTARFTLAGIDQPLELSGTIGLTIDVPHLAAALPAGTVLGPQHIVMRPIPLSQADAQGVPSLDQLVGMALNRQSREGMLLQASDVSTPLTVSKNDPVTIYYRQGPLTLTVKGQAVTGAAQGAPLQVLNLMSKRVISATAIAPGAVEITSANMALAGL
jgi:flagella basal body P-ring formation protein FlgA